MIGWLLRRRWAGVVVALAAAAGPGVFAAAPAMANSTVRITTAVDETSPGDRGCSLREAIAYADRANGGDHDCGVSPSGTTTIVVPAESSPFPLSSQLEITGKGPGPVVIAGAGVGRTTIDAEGHDRVLRVDAGATVALSGLTLTGGRSTAAEAGGGGILNLGTLSLKNVSVSGNATTSPAPGTGEDGGDGGGLLNASIGPKGSGVLTVLDSTVSANATGNGASGSGGTFAICATATQPTLGDPGGSGGGGGGIASLSGQVTIQNTTIASNTTGAGGQGGIGGSGDSGCFPAGFPGGLGGNGGPGAAVYNQGGTLSVAGSTITANTAGRGGQGGAGGFSFPPMCTGGDGRAAGAGGFGGGIANDADLTVLNSTIALNRAGGGGDGGPGGVGGFGCGSASAPGPTGSAGAPGAGSGIAQPAGSGIVTNATIAQNPPLPPFPPNFTLSSIAVASGSFIEANTIVQGGRCLGPIDDGGFNLQFRSFDCPGRQANPELEQLANNGGPTQTIAVQATSPAIDQGPAFPLVCPATDQRGDPRPDNSESACDIGAFELQDSRTLPTGLVSGAAAGPRFFTLRVHGRETTGATITVVLAKPRVLVLLVRRIARRRLSLIGYARLGEHPGGRSHFHWNLRVGRRLLPPGRYQLVLYALDGNVLSLPSKPGARALIVDAHRSAR